FGRCGEVAVAVRRKKIAAENGSVCSGNRKSKFIVESALAKPRRSPHVFASSRTSVLLLEVLPNQIHCESACPSVCGCVLGTGERERSLGNSPDLRGCRQG